jgi:hypothetical protein
MRALLHCALGGPETIYHAMNTAQAPRQREISAAEQAAASAPVADTARWSIAF